jgi:hypothetical protein
MRMKQRGKYIDPMVPAIAYQLAHGARSVWPVPQPTPEQHRNRQLERMSREAGSFASRWAELELRQEQALQRFDRDLAVICARLEGNHDG